jgi:hypothetical protein
VLAADDVLIRCDVHSPIATCHHQEGSTSMNKKDDLTLIGLFALTWLIAACGNAPFV